MKTYSASFVPTSSGYMGQLLDWPEVITEGQTVEECRGMLQDTLHEMILAYRQMNKPIPEPERLVEQISAEV
jgi:predicted RNase H-like HicB family nuclease